MLILLLIAFGITKYLAESSRPEWKKVSPFTAMEIEGETIHVEFKDNRYELVSIARIPTAELIAASKKRFGRLWEKRIREDIAEVLAAAGVENPDRVDLKLKEPGSGIVKHFPDAEMTSENRNKI